MSVSDPYHACCGNMKDYGHRDGCESSIEALAMGREAYLGEMNVPRENLGGLSLEIDDAGPASINGGSEGMEWKITPGLIMAFEESRLILDLGAQESMSEQAVRSMEHARKALTLFLERNRGYGDTGYVLGAKGQYADMNRKMGKLKHTLWDGHEAVGETEEEMLMDLIGHCLLTIDYIKEGNK